MSFTPSRLSRALLLCGVAAALVPLSAFGAASAKVVPCWVSLLNESYSGRITTIYPAHCYTQALHHIPAIATIYGNEKQQIQAAAAAAARNRLPPNRGGGAAATTTTTHSWFWKLIHKFDPGSSNAFPTPLLVLGALAILLVIAGIAGMLWQRSHPRESGPPAAP